MANGNAINKGERRTHVIKRKIFEVQRLPLLLQKSTCYRNRSRIPYEVPFSWSLPTEHGAVKFDSSGAASPAKSARMFDALVYFCTML